MKKSSLVLLVSLLFSFLGGAHAKSGTHGARHMIKEQTGRCFFYENVTKTNLGWLNKDEMKSLSRKGIKPYTGKKKQLNVRQVYVPRDWCGNKNS